MVGTIWPYATWDQTACHDRECKRSLRDPFTAFPGRRGIPGHRCEPCDFEAYDRFLTLLVERYDGDGVDDMPGLVSPVLHWEILNEPSLREPEVVFFLGDAEDYADLLQVSHDAIAEACPECQVLLGGAAGSVPEALAFWDQVLKRDRGRSFDVAGVHFILEGDLASLEVDAYRALLDRHGVDAPIWVTEAEFASAGDLTAGVAGALDAGADRVFFTQFDFHGSHDLDAGEHAPVFDEVIERHGTVTGAADASEAPLRIPRS